VQGDPGRYTERLFSFAHEKGIAIEFSGDLGSARETTKCVRETEAEAVAFVVTHAVGLDTNTAAADYIQLYQGDKATLIESLSFIQSTAAEILDFLLPGEEKKAS
jgi:hypothetical protein